MTQQPHHAATPAQRREAVHRLVDRILDVRPDLEDSIVNVLGAVSRKLQDPGTLATMQLITSAKRLLETIDRPPASGSARRGGFRASAT